MEIEQVEEARYSSIADKMARQALELERARDARPSKHAADNKETTKQIEGGQAQIEIGAQEPGIYV